MDIFPCSITILIVFCTVGVSTNDPFSTLVSYEAKQREIYGVGDGHYRLLPFRVSGGENQHFLQSPNANESIYGEIVVHWIGQNASLSFPSFDLSQKVRLTIQEQTLSTNPVKPIIIKEFLTQTGFKVNLLAGRRYRWRVQTFGKQSKLVEIAIISKPQNDIDGGQEKAKNDRISVDILKQMSQVLERAKTVRSIFGEKSSEVSELWAWMSGLEMFSLLSVFMVQIALFEKMSLPASVV